MSEPSRHRADDDIEALTSGTYRTPNGEADLLDGDASLNSGVPANEQRVSLDPDEEGDVPAPKPKLDKQARLEARLAKRTNKVMNAYKSYLKQIEVNPDERVAKIKKASEVSSDRVSKIRFALPGDGGDEEDHNDSCASIEVENPPSYRDYPYSDERESGKSNGKVHPAEYKDGLVQRSWVIRREDSMDLPEHHQTSDRFYQEDTFLDYDDVRNKFGIEAGGSPSPRTTSYKYPQLREKRVKRGILFIALVVIVVAISSGVITAKKKANLPDWEAELAEVQKEEQQKHMEKQQQKQEEMAASGVISHDGEVMSEKPPPASAKEDVEAMPRPPNVEAVEPTDNNPISKSPYKDIAATFKPIAFDRSKGWDGTTYNEAVEFCNEIENHSLCPYQAVCPLGENSKPSGGYKSTGSWLAISDEPNAWVHLGSLNSCTKYEEDYSDWPDEGATKNIICCQITEYSPKASFAVETAAADESSAADETAPAVVDETTAQGSMIAPMTQEEQEQLNDVSNKLQPIFYNRSHDWVGQTYSAALEFCASKDSRVPCPYTAVCPNGSGRPPLGGIKENNRGSFVPIIDSPNSWVQLSSNGVCELFSALYGSPPQWGLSGESNEDMTRNILCCKEPTESFDSNSESTTSDQAGVASSNSEVAGTDADTLAAAAGLSGSSSLTSTEQSVLDIMHPLWFSRKHGWQGTTWDDATEFCKNVGGMSVCPKEAYCPNGPDVKNRAPLFLDQDAFDGEQWAPTSGHSNSWILVGTSDGDPTSTCMSHEDLHGGNTPSWGEDGTFTHLKENVMCCVNPSSSINVESISDSEPVDADKGSETLSQNDSPTTVATNSENAFDLEKVMQDKLKPLWLGAAEGWNGGSHDDAVEYCKTIRGKQLCPYSAYCPYGAGKPVMGRHKVDFNAQGELYAPVFGIENHWVMIGQKGENSATTCMSHYQLEGSNPAWGLTTDRPELKKYVMCCTMNV